MHPPAATEAKAPPARHVGVDAARGLAVLLMIQTHAYDAFTEEPARASFAYALTRQLGAIPAPLFLLLAGVGVGLSEARSRDLAALRRTLIRRGVEIVLAGYAVSFGYALLDGALTLRSLLGADILHAIGLSLVTCALCVVGTRGAAPALGLCCVSVMVGPLLSRAELIAHIPAWLAPLAALLVDVPPYTRFPLLPLVAFTALGVLVGRALAGSTESRTRTRGQWLGAALLAACAAALSALATRALVLVLGGSLSRAHPAIVANVLDGAARALSILLLGLALDLKAPRWLLALGRSSLFAYAFHIPFCYARFARPLRHRFGMGEATALTLALMLATLAAVQLADRLKQTRRSHQPSRLPD